MNGKVASTDVRTISGGAYVKIADIARALGMTVVQRGNTYEIKKAGGANPIKGVTQGKIGDVLFDGHWRFQVISVTSPGSYVMKTPSDSYDNANLSTFDYKNRELRPAEGYRLVVVQCRATNGQNQKFPLWTAISDDKMNTALTDTDGGSHPPIAYDYEGSPTQTRALIPGAAITFPILFVVSQDTKIKDLVFTLHSNGNDVYNDVRVSLN
jgi:hypothetical protein